MQREIRTKAQKIEYVARQVYSFSPLLDKKWEDLSEDFKNESYRVFARQIVEGLGIE